MKKINVGMYSITIQSEPDYSFRSTDNKYYDDVINLMGNEDFDRTISLHIETDCCIKEVALIVPYHTNVNACALPAGEFLFLMLNDILCLFDPVTMKVVKQNKLDILGVMFAAYPYKQDFILYGELEIYRITKELSICWHTTRLDIFLDFEMKNDRICLSTLEGGYYEIDYNGKSL